MHNLLLCYPLQAFIKNYYLAFRNSLFSRENICSVIKLVLNTGVYIYRYMRHIFLFNRGDLYPRD